MSEVEVAGAEDRSRATVVIYGDVDLNYLDGSSIWLVSLASVVALLDVDVHVVLKADIDRQILTDDLAKLQHVYLHEPSSVVSKSKLRGSDIVTAVAAVDELVDATILITRGWAATTEIAASGRYDRRLWPYLTDIPQQPEDMTDQFIEAATDVFAASDRVLCQTEQLRAFLASYFPESDNKMILLPPMIPDGIGSDSTPRLPGALRLFYAGKFAPAWGIEELVAAVGRLRLTHPEAELVVAGDKIHNPPDDPEYSHRVREALGADGVTWLGAIERAGVFDALKNVDLAVSVRDVSLNSSRELSTKLLEYAAAGVAVAANRTLMHEELFGVDYPLLLDGYEDLDAALSLVAKHPQTLDRLRTAVTEVAQEHTYSSVAERLEPLVRSVVQMEEAPRLDGLKIGVPSHDLKFAGPLLGSLADAGALIRIDEWYGHDRHDVAHSESVLEWADVVLAEWCLANAVWFAERRRPNQRLLVRLHRTEINSAWATRLNIDQVTGVYFVGDHIRDEAARRFGWPVNKLHTIPNFVDPVMFDRKKLPGAEFNLGMLGYLPQLKRLDLALDILEDVRRQDARYRLIVKGKLPWELSWVWQDAHEREFFEEQFRRIRTSPLLRTAVTFDRAGPDTASWFRKIGLVLSLSDVESFHLSMIEGMLSGAVPVIVDRPGVCDIVESDWVHPSAGHAADWLATVVGPDIAVLGAKARQEAQARYTIEGPAIRWRSAIAQGL